MNYLEQFREIRRVSTPWCVVTSPDYRAAIKLLAKVRINGEAEPPMVVWDCIGGHSGLNEDGREAANRIGDAEMTFQAPVLLLTKALALPEDTVLFFVVPKSDLLLDAGIAQAVANLRDEFKSNRRTLVLMGVSVQLPELIAADVPILEDELPNAEELRAIIADVSQVAGVKVPAKDAERAVDVLAGLTRFAAEEGVARKLRKSGIDVAGLGELQRSTIEASSNRALTWERETWTFDDVGGLAAFKGFMGDIFAGPKKPSLIVRVDEIDKAISAGATGSVADNTGVSQDQLGVFLRSMEENKWCGLIAAGGPGTGKSLSSICAGNTFGARTLVLDLGSTKASLVGESERRIRQVMAVLKSIGGDRVCFMATCNRLDTLPPELQRRFWLGTWLFSVPTAEEKQAIWKIQMARFGIKSEQPNDDDWTGSDIRNCCQMAWITGTDLKTAAGRITVAGKASRDQIDKLNDLADRSGFLSANEPGPYKKNKATQGRKMSIT